MLIEQTGIVFKLNKEDIEIEDAINDMINEAENHAWYYDIILFINDKKYIINQTLMDSCNWNKDKLLQLVLNQ